MSSRVHEARQYHQKRKSERPSSTTPSASPHAPLWQCEQPPRIFRRRSRDVCWVHVQRSCHSIEDVRQQTRLVTTWARLARLDTAGREVGCILDECKPAVSYIHPGPIHPERNGALTVSMTSRSSGMPRTASARASERPSRSSQIQPEREHPTHMYRSSSHRIASLPIPSHL